MRNNAYYLSSYNFTSGEKILIDTNIWLYLFPAPSSPNHRFAQQYSNGMRDLFAANAKPIITTLVISEYINSYCRIEWNATYKSLYPAFKDFRKSPEFQSVAQSVVSYTKRILHISQQAHVLSDKPTIEKILDTLETGEADFNDLLLVSYCRDKDWKLMTNDSDIFRGGVDILTTNPNLISKCRAS